MNLEEKAKVTEARREKFEAAFGKWLEDNLVGVDCIPMFFERDKEGRYRSVQVESAWWGWNASLESEA